MSELVELIKVFFIGSFGITALGLVLIALPNSQLKGFFLELYSKSLYAVTGLLVLYVISPLDLIMDVIPILGQLDDAAALVAAIFTGCMGWLSGLQASNEMVKS